jgi:hypothetical protein
VVLLEAEPERAFVRVSSYAIEYSLDLVNWTVLGTNTPTNGVFHFTLPTGSETPAGFYHSALLPGILPAHWPPLRMQVRSIPVPTCSLAPLRNGRATFGAS